MQLYPYSFILLSLNHGEKSRVDLLTCLLENRSYETSLVLNRVPGRQPVLNKSLSKSDIRIDTTRACLPIFYFILF